MTFIYGEIADGLADQVVADGEAFSRYPRVSRAALYVTVVFESLVHLEVVAPACELKAIVAHLLGEGCEFLQGKVCPLAGKQGYGSCHDSSCSYFFSFGRGSHKACGALEDAHKGARELRQIRPAGARDDVAVHHVRSLLEGGTGGFEIRL